jgi:hypothetical protein
MSELRTFAIADPTPINYLFSLSRPLPTSTPTSYASKFVHVPDIVCNHEPSYDFDYSFILSMLVILFQCGHHSCVNHSSSAENPVAFYLFFEKLYITPRGNHEDRQRSSHEALFARPSTNMVGEEAAAADM